MHGRLRWAAGSVVLLGFLGACDGGSGGSAGGDPTPAGSASASVSASPSASVSASPSASVSPSASPTVKPTVTPTPKPTATPVAGTPMSAAGAYLEVSEDPNLTTPDPENGCEVHDPDLTVSACKVVKMAGGTVTWVVGREKTTLPGADEPRMVVRIYRRHSPDTDEMTHVGYGEPGTWADVRVRVVSLTGQPLDTLVVEVTFRGSGTLKGYDLLTWRKGAAGPSLAAHHEEGGKAAVRVQGQAVHFYAADYSDGAPNCCPTRYTHDRAQWDPKIGKFRLLKLGTVKQPPS